MAVGLETIALLSQMKFRSSSQTDFEDAMIRIARQTGRYIEHGNLSMREHVLAKEMLGILYSYSYELQLTNSSLIYDVYKKFGGVDE
jgi:hypothetical protein